MKRRPISLKNGLLTYIVACCVFSVVIVMIVSATLLSINIARSSRSKFETEADGAIRQVGLRLSAAIESSKAVSYNGEVKNAYKDYLVDKDSAALYRSCTEYLNQNFSRDERVCAVYISFRDKDISLCPYVISTYNQSYLTLRQYLDSVQDDLFSYLGTDTTGIFFRVYNGNLYMVRNLLDLQFQSFATLSMQLNTEVIFQVFLGLSSGEELRFSLDGIDYRLTPDGRVLESNDFSTGLETESLSFSAEADGHSIICARKFTNSGLKGLPELSVAVLIACILVLPLIIGMVILFRRHITRPVGILIDATGRVRKGERGYQITEKAESREIDELYSHFNEMSEELRIQFDRSYSEQQALMQVRIKALQSQINPHFLNNTLEVINWESRLAGNEKVSAMIESLSTLLNAALDRDGRNIITLKEELSYVDAYLTIIQERLGKGFTHSRSVDESLLEYRIPRLILQPIVENAVEHDITPRRKGCLDIRVYVDNGFLILDVEHDGVMTEEDIRNISSLINIEPESNEFLGSRVGQVGVRNVSQRLKIIYGEKGMLRIEQSSPEKILARISLPVE